MALNAFMHPDNPYKDKPPDFKMLADSYPNFKKHLKTSKSDRIYLDFRNPNSVRELYLTLMHKDFNMEVDLPKDRLAPTIPSRLNYILWLRDLLKCVPRKSESSRKILDIGCGSSCVYGMLGVSLNSDWNVLATEIDPTNHQFAARNVIKNDLASKIEIRRVTSSDPLLPDDIDIDACMCNPPFFNDKETMDSTRLRPTANSSCSGSLGETCYEGGDFEFAKRLLLESLTVSTRITWYTTLLGRKKSCTALLKLLRQQDDIKYTVSFEFCQGRTMRWGVAWTFLSDVEKSKFPMSPFAASKSSNKCFKSKELSFISKYDDLLNARDALIKLIEELHEAYETVEQDEKIVISVVAYSRTWVNCRKRKRQGQLVECVIQNENSATKGEVMDCTNEKTPVLICNVVLDKSEYVTFTFRCAYEFKLESNRFLVFLKTRLS